MNRWIASALQVVVVFIGLGALTFLLVEPHLEGVNARRTVAEIYFQDPFLAYVYLGSIAFFVALYRAFKLLGSVRRNGEPTPTMLVALLGIRRCGYVLLSFVAGGTAFIIRYGDPADRPAGFMMCLLATVVAGGITLLAAWCAR